MRMAQTPVKSADSPVGAPAPRRSRTGIWLAAGVAVMVVAGVLSYLGIHKSQQSAYQESLRPTGIPASVSTSLATLMGLTPVQHTGAPDFTLTDQAGHTMSMASFHGKSVVLEFMDPHCTDICPIVSAEFVKAYHDLGAQAKNVVFVAVNVNQYHAKVSDMAAYSGEHGLNALPTWHFFTGPVPTLKKVWSGYDIEVHAPNPNADVIHTSTIYFISPSGTEEFAAAPMEDKTANGTSYLPAGQIADWGTGIAKVARQLLG
jgi:cytochrome oxidase Cu insertion factor (SCO1/SenC/PrrC family)